MTARSGATAARQSKLVGLLFQGASLKSAWLQAGYSPAHHANLAKVLSSPATAEMILARILAGEKLYEPLHERVLKKLTAKLW